MMDDTGRAIMGLEGFSETGRRSKALIDAVEHLAELADGDLLWDMATLASFALSSPGSCPKNRPEGGFSWCSRAVDEKEPRQYLRAVRDTGDSLVGTDGHRVHVARGAGSGREPSSILRNGDVTREKPFNWFPATEQLFDKTRDGFESLELFERSYAAPIDGEISVVLNGEGGPRINARYYRAAVPGFNVPEVLAAGEHDAVYFVERGESPSTSRRVAAIMPMKGKERSPAALEAGASMSFTNGRARTDEARRCARRVAERMRV